MKELLKLIKQNFALNTVVAFFNDDAHGYMNSNNLITKINDYEKNNRKTNTR